jgi:hydroxyacylglutathione hydrolase
MVIQRFVFSPFQENTFVVYSDNLEAMIIDPGCYSSAEEQKLLTFIQSNNLNVKYLVNTHSHIDHVFGNAFVEETWKVSSSANAGDDFWIKGMAAQYRMFGLEMRKQAPPIGHFLNEGDFIQLGDAIFTIFQVPGHSPGSIVLYNAGQHCLFAGDVLFEGGIGRTDLQGGDYQQIIQGIQGKLMVLPDETVVYPGHGSNTTIGQERRTNPYL